MCVSKVKRQPTERGEMFANHAAVLKSTENSHRTAIKAAAAQFQTRQETGIEAIPEICRRPVSSPRYSSRKDHNNAQRHREIRTILHCFQECCNSKYAPDNLLAIYSKKLNVKESNDPASPLLAICPGEMNVCLYKTTCINAHSSTAHKSQKKKKWEELKSSSAEEWRKRRGASTQWNTTQPYKYMPLTTGTNLLSLRC